MDVGDRVFRKGFSLQWGIVRRLFTVRPPHGAMPSSPIPTHAEVDWHAPNRIGGRGFHRSCLTLSALILATDEERDRRIRKQADRRA